jgi:hypothetical protein
MTKFTVNPDTLSGLAVQVEAALDSDDGGRSSAPSSAEFGHAKLASAARAFITAGHTALDLHRDQAREVKERLEKSAETYAAADEAAGDPADQIESTIPNSGGQSTGGPG